MKIETLQELDKWIDTNWSLEPWSKENRQRFSTTCNQNLYVVVCLEERDRFDYNRQVKLRSVKLIVRYAVEEKQFRGIQLLDDNYYLILGENCMGNLIPNNYPLEQAWIYTEESEANEKFKSLI